MAKNQFNGEILHAGSIRMRVTGSGSLIQTLYSLQDVSSEELTDLTMSATTDQEVITLADFKSQRISLDLRVELINEYFNISKIIIYIKPIASGLPL